MDTSTTSSFKSTLMSILLFPEELKEIEGIPLSFAVAMKPEVFEPLTHINTLYAYMTEVLRGVNAELPYTNGRAKKRLHRIASGKIDKISEKRNPNSYALAELIQTHFGVFGWGDAFSSGNKWAYKNAQNIDYERLNSFEEKISTYRDHLFSTPFFEEREPNGTSLLSDKVFNVYHQLAENLIFLPWVQQDTPNSQMYVNALQAYATFRSKAMACVDARDKKKAKKRLPVFLGNITR